MENELTQTHHKKGRLNKKLLLATIVIAVLFFAGGYYFMRKLTAHTALGTSIKEHRKFDMSVLRQTPAPLTDKQKQQLSAGTSTTTKEKRFYVTGGNFYFTPNTITVNQGDNVKILINDINGFHDFTIDALHVRTTVIRAGQFAVASFTADKRGTYEFYSSLPSDRQLGMKGTLVVQ